MKNILFIRQNAPGGTDRFCHMVYNLFENDEDYKPLEIKDYPTYSIPVLHYAYKTETLRKAILTADIVVINGYTALGTVQAILMAHKCGKKIVYAPHWHPFKFLHFPIISKIVFYSLFFPVIKKYVDVIATINNEDTNFMKKIKSNAVQIPHCLGIKVPKTKKERKKNMILFVGSSTNRVKGFEHLEHLPIGIYDIHCVGKGNMPQRSDFHQHTNVSDEELSQLYSQASLTVVPSRYEAFCYVALEAMTQGCPVLMSERVKIADHLYGIKGYDVFKYRDYISFCNKIKDIIGESVDREKIKETFSKERIKSMYKSLFDSISK